MAIKEIYRNQRITAGALRFIKKTVFRYGLGQCVYQISGLFRFLFGQRVRHRQTDIYTIKYGKTLIACIAWILNI